MSNRKTTLDLIRIAGYHNDTKAFTRLYCESKLSRTAANEAWQVGATQKQNGIKCHCADCSKIKTLATFVAYSGSLATLDCELVLCESTNSVFLDYTIIAPFVTKGKKERQTWSWSSNYPRDRLLSEARAAMESIAAQMWGVR